MTRDLALALIDHHVPSFRDHLAARLQSSIRIAATRLPYDGDQLKSKFGGAPLLPESMPWPTWDSTLWHRSAIAYRQRKPNPRRGSAPDPVIVRHEQSLNQPPVARTFIAQLRLLELPVVTSIALPPDGQLLFFYVVEDAGGSFDPASIGSGQVIYVPEHEIPNTARQPPPNVVAYTPATLSFTPQWTLPDDLRDEGIDLSRWKNEAYAQLLSDLYDPDQIIHRIGGHSQPIQNDMRLEAQLVTHGIWCGDPSGYEDQRRPALEAGAADWQLLLQIDTDEDGPGWMWGDAGRLYFWGRRQDLVQREFDRVWCCEQCF